MRCYRFVMGFSFKPKVHKKNASTLRAISNPPSGLLLLTRYNFAATSLLRTKVNSLQIVICLPIFYNKAT